MVNDQSLLMTSFLMSAVLAIGIILIVINVLFLWSLYKALKLVPEENYIFPNWFVWLILVPLVGLIFQWMMLPFGVPQAFKKTVAGNEEAVRSSKVLFSLGLAFVILVTLGPILPLITGIGYHPQIGTSLPFTFYVFYIVVIVIWISYWCKVVQFRRKYLDSRAQSTAPRIGS